MKPFSAARDSARRSTCRGSAQDGRAVGQQDVAEHPGALAADPALEREHLERGRVRHRDHVGLVDPGEALDRRAVEPDALLEGRLQLGRRHRDALERAQHVGEPQPDEPDVPLLQRPEHELLLTVHDSPLALGRCDLRVSRAGSAESRPRACSGRVTE